ncbi:MAG: ParB N-terminal domain-containing protein [Syntrophomonadaceae bacterium]|jgi:hypothetical protein
MAKRKKTISHPRAITFDPDFIPCQILDNHEYFPNGIFIFNISRMISFIEAHEEELISDIIDVDYYYRLQEHLELNEDFVRQADLTRPVILAEITPDRFKMGMGINPNIYYERGYNLIDGHHRVAKAYTMGIKTLPAYILRMEQHINFLAQGYKEYVEYWNDKLRASGA